MQWDGYGCRTVWMFRVFYCGCLPWCSIARVNWQKQSKSRIERKVGINAALQFGWAAADQPPRQRLAARAC